MRGDHGDFFSVTWPGYVGVLTAMAPQRFAAALNQAPMWRRTRHRLLRPADYAASVLHAAAGAGRMPPDQLLRRAFEVCDDFAAARRLLETTPVARPVIYTLVGCAANERCVIERTETAFRHARARYLRGKRLGAMPVRLGRPHRHTAVFGVLIRRSGRIQPGPARRTGGLEWLIVGKLFWLGARAGPQPLYETCGCDESGRWNIRVAGYDITDGLLPQPVTQLREIEALQQAA